MSTMCHVDFYAQNHYIASEFNSLRKAKLMSDHSRRKLFKSVVIGSGIIVAGKSLPESWTRPVVNSVVLPAHAATSCLSCLDVTSYCEGQGPSGNRVDVAADGTITVTHQDGNLTSSASDTVDMCNGGGFSVSLASSGNNPVLISGNIPCGVTDSITVTVDDGQSQSPFDLELFKSFC